MSYSPHTDADRRHMLDAIGVESVDDLFVDIPASVRPTSFAVPPGLTEQEVRAELSRLAAKNRLPEVSFLGAGAYRHLIPAVVDEVVGRAEFSTAYTPYQPEVSQGTLQTIYEFQSLICELTAMEVATASHYDGATATAEAVLMACRLTGRHAALVSGAVHPHVREVIGTYASGPGVEIREVAADLASAGSGLTSVEAVEAALGPEVACVVVAQPNLFGGIEAVEALAESAHRSGALLIVQVEPVSLAVLEAPGEQGADIVTAEGQPFGIPLAFGGPYLGLMAARMGSVRQMPGRLVGATRDTVGRRGYVLTLQAREQHIRREKAASNICTNQALCALAATAYLSAIGPAGLTEVAELGMTQARYLVARLEESGLARRRFDGPYVAEVVVELADAQRRYAALVEIGIVAGWPLGPHYPELADCLLLATTELTTDADIDRLLSALEASR